MDQALELERAAHNLKKRLIVRYMVFNGLSPTEIAEARIEHLDPVEGTLFLPRRHWKLNCVCSIDPETIRLQAIYSGSRKVGPLVRSNKGGGHFGTVGIYYVIKRLAAATTIPDARSISPRTLKRTFAREWLLAGGSVASLQKQFSHKHLWSTAHYLRFVLEDVRRDHVKLMQRVKHGEASERPRLRLALPDLET